MTQQPLHPIIVELCEWAWELGMRDLSFTSEELALKHHEIKMRYYERNVKGRVPK